MIKVVHQVKSQIRCIALRVFQTSKGFWVFLFRQSFEGGGGGVELTQITMQRARPVWPAMTLDCSRIVKEFAMVRGIFVHIFNSEVKHHVYVWQQTLNGDER